MKLLAVGDLHLNERSGLGPERLADQEAIWRRAFEVGAEEDVDAVLFAGDAFEHRRPTPAELLAFQRPLWDYTKEPSVGQVYAIPGNHDIEHAERPAGLDLFRLDLELHRMPGLWEHDGLTIAALPWVPISRLVADSPETTRDDLYVAAATKLEAAARGMRHLIDGPAVLLAHWSVTGASTPDGIPAELFREPVLDLHALEDQGWDAIVLGHIHKPQQLQSLDGERPLFYTGSPLPLSHGEASCEHGVFILEGPPFEARFVALESRRFVTIDEYASAHDQLGLELVADPSEVADAIVRLRLTGRPEDMASFNLAAVRRAILEAGAWRVTVEPTIIREQPARVEEMTAELSAEQALGLWLAENEIAKERHLGLFEAHRYFRDKVA